MEIYLPLNTFELLVHFGYLCLTNIKLANTKKEFKEQVTAEGEDINVKIVTIDVTKIGKFAESSHPNRTGKQAAEKWHKTNGLNLKKICMKIYKK